MESTKDNLLSVLAVFIVCVSSRGIMLHHMHRRVRGLVDGLDDDRNLFVGIVQKTKPAGPFWEA
jgi:hypothetical protein